MKSLLYIHISRIFANRKRKWMPNAVIAPLVLVIVALVFNVTAYRVVALENEFANDRAQHVHARDCYERILVCDFSEDAILKADVDSQKESGQSDGVFMDESTAAAHTHTDGCYEEYLICGLDEYEPEPKDIVTNNVMMFSGGYEEQTAVAKICGNNIIKVIKDAADSQKLFTFRLTQTEEDRTPVNPTHEEYVTVEGEGKIEFELTGLTDGTYYYKITVVSESFNSEWDYDDSEFVVKVTVVGESAEVTYMHNHDHDVAEVACDHGATEDKHGEGFWISDENECCCYCCDEVVDINCCGSNISFVNTQKIATVTDDGKDTQGGGSKNSSGSGGSDPETGGRSENIPVTLPAVGIPISIMSLNSEIELPVQASDTSESDILYAVGDNDAVEETTSSNEESDVISGVKETEAVEETKDTEDTEEAEISDNDESSQRPTSPITDGSSGETSSQESGESGEAPIGTMTSDADALAVVTISGTNNADSAGFGKVFGFKLTQVNEEGMLIDSPYEDITTTMGNGDFSFVLNDIPDGITYYKITAEAYPSDGWDYDSSEYFVTVTLNAGEADIIYGINSGESVSNIVFTNRLAVEAVTDVTIIGYSDIIGADHTTEQFEIVIEQVANSSGVPMLGGHTDTEFIDGAGSFSFSVENLAAGAYYYKIYEVARGWGEGWVYDDTSYVVEVNVDNNLDTNIITHIPEDAVEILFVNEFVEPGGPDLPVTGGQGVITNVAMGLMFMFLAGLSFIIAKISPINKKHTKERGDCGMR